MKDQNLVKKFSDLTKEVLSNFQGTLEEKMAAWSQNVLTSSLPKQFHNLLEHDQLESAAQTTAKRLIHEITKFLNENEADNHIAMIASELEVHLDKTSLRVGDNQLGYIVADVMKGVQFDSSARNKPIAPSYISLYKYVTWETMVKILESGKLKASEPRKCNDVYEFMPAWETQEKKEDIFQIMEGLETVMLCFSRTPTSSVMWGHYAGNGTGALLQFQVPVYKLIAGVNEHECMLVIAKDEIELQQNEHRPILISQVTYSEQRPSYQAKKSYYSYDQFYSRKGTDWAYEQEMRIHFNSDDYDTTQGKDGFLTSVLTPYLTGVVLGPRCTHNEDEIQSLVRGRFEGQQSLRIQKTEYSPRHYKLDSHLQETPPVETIPLYKRIVLGIPPVQGEE